MGDFESMFYVLESTRNEWPTHLTNPNATYDAAEEDVASIHSKQDSVNDQAATRDELDDGSTSSVLGKEDSTDGLNKLKSVITHASISDILKGTRDRAKARKQSLSSKSDSTKSSKKQKTAPSEPPSAIFPPHPPIFIISILPHTCLPAQSFQRLLPPLSPHHYPPVSPRWPVLSPPLSQYAKNVYVKKYPRSNQVHPNTYLPVQYKDRLKSLRQLAHKDALMHPTVSKLWRKYHPAQAPVTDQNRAQSAQSSEIKGPEAIEADDGYSVEHINFESSFNSLVGSYYGLPTRGVVNLSDLNEENKANSSSESCNEEEEPTKEAYDRYLLQPHRTPSGSFAEQIHSGTFSGSTAQGPTHCNAHHLADELLACSSVLGTIGDIPLCADDTVLCLGYFGECAYENLPPQPLQVDPSSHLLQNNSKVRDVSSRPVETFSPNQIPSQVDKFQPNSRIPLKTVEGIATQDQATESSLVQSEEDERLSDDKQLISALDCELNLEDDGLDPFLVDETDYSAVSWSSRETVAGDTWMLVRLIHI